MFDRKQFYNDNIYIWNPLVQKVKRVLTSSRCTLTFQEIQWKALAFGFLPEVNDYVVVHIVKPSCTSKSEFLEYPHSVVIGVYSLNTNSWKKICQDKVSVDELTTNDSVFVNGTAFWVGFHHVLDQLVMFFDTKTNLLGKIVVPGYFVLYKRCLYLPFRLSIAYFVEVSAENFFEESDDDDDDASPHLDIWVLKDDMKGEFSWQKKMSVSLGENVGADVFGTRNNGEPILAKLNDLIAYDIDTHEPYDFIESCDRLTPCYSYKKGFKPPFVINPFVETLVLFDMDRDN